MTIDRRYFQRVKYSCPAMLKLKGGEARTVEVENVSLKGVLLREIPFDCRAHPGQSADLEMQLAPDVEIVMSLEVVFFADGRLGARWVEIELDGMTHLRQLLSLNLGDAELVDRELATMLHPDLEV